MGPPPESAAATDPHRKSTIVLVQGLHFSITDSHLKKECIERVGRPRFIYMHVSDIKSGLFSGTAVIEFTDEESVTKALSQGILGNRVRSVSDEEFSSLTSGEWPMLNYGPPQGVFSSTSRPPPGPAVAVPVWAQAGRAPVANPWLK